MPLYEFYCESCQKRFEELCSLAAADRMVCPACGRIARRQLSGFAVKSGGTFKSSAASGSCGSCSGGSCASCGH